MGPLPTCAIPFGLSLRPMGLSGACRSWEDCALGDLGVSQTCLIVAACVMLSFVPINLVEACSEQGWEAVHSTGLASHHRLRHGMLARKRKADEIRFLEVYLGFLFVNKKIKVKGSSGRGNNLQINFIL